MFSKSWKHRVGNCKSMWNLASRRGKCAREDSVFCILYEFSSRSTWSEILPRVYNFPRKTKFGSNPFLVMEPLVKRGGRAQHIIRRETRLHIGLQLSTRGFYLSPNTIYILSICTSSMCIRMLSLSNVLCVLLYIISLPHTINV